MESLYILSFGVLLSYFHLIPLNSQGDRIGFGKRMFKFFGDHRLVEVFRENSSAPALDLQEAILAAVDRFSDEGAPCDDETVVLIKRGDAL